ncbi:MAG: hypothetical protein RBT11_14895 [Desulfobacterales bacterium]|nr:hypothetical protein [Desulfobacterales bacterium]
MMIRNLFVREEADQVILGAGVFPEWLKKGESIEFGPTPVPGGALTVAFTSVPEGLAVNLKTQINPQAVNVTVAVPNFEQRELAQFNRPVLLAPTPG